MYLFNHTPPRSRLIEHTFPYPTLFQVHARRIISPVVPCEDTPVHTLAIGRIGRRNPAADLALENVERPPVGLGLIGIVGQGMIAIILRLEREFVGHESPSSSSSAATNSPAMRPTSEIGRAHV